MKWAVSAHRWLLVVAIGLPLASCGTSKTVTRGAPTSATTTGTSAKPLSTPRQQRAAERAKKQKKAHEAPKGAIPAFTKEEIEKAKEAVEKHH